MRTDRRGIAKVCASVADEGQSPFNQHKLTTGGGRPCAAILPRHFLPCPFPYRTFILILSDSGLCLRSIRAGMPPNRAAMAQTPCRFFQAGYCARGDTCWYKHDASEEEINKPVASTSYGSGSGVNDRLPKGQAPRPGNKSDAPASSNATGKAAAAVVATEEHECGICFNVPKLYGLLDCSHCCTFVCISACLRSLCSDTSFLRDALSSLYELYQDLERSSHQNGGPTGQRQFDCLPSLPGQVAACRSLARLSSQRHQQRRCHRFLQGALQDHPLPQLQFERQTWPVFVWL